MQKDTLMKTFLRGFIKSFLIIIVLVGVGFGSYKLTMLYYEKVEPPKASKTEGIIKDIVSDVKIEDISKNLIYRIKEDTGEVTGLVLEIFNTYTYNMDYITIPVNTQFTMSNDMYQRLCTVNQEVPQIIQLSDLYKYFEEKNRYEYGEIILEDLISVDISYYTVMKDTDFNAVFGEKDGAFVLNDDFMVQMTTDKEKDQLKEAITGVYENVESNLTLKNKLKYLGSFMQVNSDYIYYHCLQGTSASGYFTADIQKSNELIQKILSNEAYTKAQESITQESKPSSSLGLNIEILNGSGISGLAAAYKDKLSADGLTISHIGNYSDPNVTTTMIYVKEEGMGEDLLPYFNNATIQVTELAESTDIQIVLGSADPLQ